MTSPGGAVPAGLERSSSSRIEDQQTRQMHGVPQLTQASQRLQANGGRFRTRKATIKAPLHKRPNH